VPALDAAPGDLAGAPTRGAAHGGRGPANSPTSTGSRPRWPRRSNLAQDFSSSCASASLTALIPAAARNASALRPCQRFAKGLSEDYEAVKAGVTYPVDRPGRGPY